MGHSALWLILISVVSSCGLCYGHRVSHYTYYNQASQSCHWYFGKRCSWKHETKSRCTTGYGGSACNEPKCRFGYGHYTCNVNDAGYVKLKNGQVNRNSGGYCSTPGRCINCNTGYYPTTSSGGYCTWCYHPAKCNLNDCSSSYDRTCEYCEGEHARDKPGFNVYTGKPDQTKCQRACSWVYGARCFPGSCSGYMVLDKDCKCAKGFGGYNCATATSDKLPTITEMSLKLVGGPNNHVLILHQAISTLNWTNTNKWSKLTVNASSHYKLENVGDPPNYIKDFSVGIENMKLVVTLLRDKTEEDWTIDKSCTNFSVKCQHSVSSELRDISRWQETFDKEPGIFKHTDRIRFTVSARNGGTVVYEDRDSFINKTYMLTGIQSAQTMELRFDFVQPDHCFLRSNNCPIDAFIAEDTIKEPVVPVKWGGWIDLDSGIEKYTLIIYKLVNTGHGEPLRDGNMLAELSYNSSVSSAALHLRDLGPYSIELYVYDTAGNYRVARRIVMYDNASVVELNGKQPTIRQTNQNKWINTATDLIEIDWTNRFHNARHGNSWWLNAVESKYEIPRDLDDTDAKYMRTINSIDHQNGIVRFEIASLIEINDTSTLTDFGTVPDKFFHQQKMIYNNLSFVDGERITFIIRGVDIMGEYAEDNVTAMIDLSPPIIKNLWLTKGDWVNISVHNVLDFSNLTIEWEVYDFHSGLYDINWRIFDNYTRDAVVYVQSNEFSQGQTNNISECDEKYGSYPRGQNCYCSPYNGCFHKHYQVKPSAGDGDTSGFVSGEQTGVHGFDYFIEVTATNNAGLTNVVHKKITIDVSPPHEGTVHDGLLGNPEVDFQQSLELSGHWDGFFDKESSVWFYAYGFSDRCLNEEDLDAVTLPNMKGNWTYNNWAEFTAESVGTYYLTVMAFNHAFGASRPVCSDGVTIDIEPAVVSEIVVKDAVTASGLVKDETSDTLYVLNRNRELEQVQIPISTCRDRALPVADTVLNTYPKKINLDGSIVLKHLDSNCGNYYNVHSTLISYISSDTIIDISWNATFGAGNVHDYEVGIASENSEIPDIMDFTSTHNHQHIRLFHPNVSDGEHFYILIKSTTKAGVIDKRVVGPFVFDSSKPRFEGSIEISVEETIDGTILIANWDLDAFTDHGDPYALTYEAAIGSSKNGQDIFPFSNISTTGSCNSSKPPVCAAFRTDSLPWNLHGGQKYFVTIKVKDTIGHFLTVSSNGYVHNVELASVGVVQDIDNSINKFSDIQDVDFQTNTAMLKVHWSGFEHPHETILFTICVSNGVNEEYILCERSLKKNEHTFETIHLVPYMTYYQTVIAETKAGNVTALSDGVTIVVEGDTVEGIQVYDGLPCNSSRNTGTSLTRSHHDEDTLIHCNKDTEFQASLNSLQAHWIIPDNKKHYLRDIFWTIDEQDSAEDIWKNHTGYQYMNTTTSYMEQSQLELSPGQKYRVSLKFCAKQFCFKPVASNGVIIAPNPPSTGSMSINYIAVEKRIDVLFDGFTDTDAADIAQSRNVMDYYEWAFADESNLGRLLTRWQRISLSNANDHVKLNFSIILEREISFTKCWLLVIRGYTKAGLSSTISSVIKPCGDRTQVRPGVVIDAIDATVSTVNDHTGKAINLAKYSVWREPDIDYTPYNNILSAVWPTLRHGKYKWAVLHLEDRNTSIFHSLNSGFPSTNLCEEPNTIVCGVTENEFVNVFFNDGGLEHGSRYTICIQADSSTLQHRFWVEKLEAVSECSNGVTIDLTPPLTADVWIGNNKEMLYQTSTSILMVNWNSFLDVEENGFAAHPSGISHYEVALGTSPGGTDIKSFVNVGLTNHKTFHGLSLQNGKTYYATVIGYDFITRSSSSTSKGIEIDSTAPTLMKASITLPSKYISDKSLVEACWNDVFLDLESGISHYRWAIGTYVGYDDITPFTYTEHECTNTGNDLPLELQEGHAYFLTVQAHNKAGLFTSTSSLAFTVETSPPIPGKVFDGPIGVDLIPHDIDFIDGHSLVQAHWKGFHDPHTTIIEFFVSLGSCKGCEDILQRQRVGIETDIDFGLLSLSEGVHYYVTVTACNPADLCSNVSSDGFIVDSTPPVKEIVTDGSFDYDIQYQASRNSIGCTWNRFTDPQSGIYHYTWRVGTTKGSDNIIPSTLAHKHENAFILDLKSEYGIELPKDARLYCTVRAYNKAGKHVEASSDGFVVDDTPPVFTTPLSMSSLGTIYNRTSVLRKLFRVYWEVEDNESFIQNQYLSISSHIGGDFNLSSVKVIGIARNYTFMDLDLHDGSRYTIKLVSCNGANICSNSFIPNILVDSSPPTKGTFAIDTDHAAALDRQRGNWMAWTRFSINLAWLGFEDSHSEIKEYNVNVGTDFMGDDLNEIPGRPMKIRHNNNAPFYEDGKVQTFRIQTRKLKFYQRVYISVTAINGVGLSSAVSHAKFYLVYGGIMEPVRRCQSYSCLGHCVCSPDGQFCQSRAECNDVTGKENVALRKVEVTDYLDLRFPSIYSPSNISPINTMLAAKWRVAEGSGSRPLWYEWSVCESEFDCPSGVLHVGQDNIWHEAGKDTHCVFTVDRGRKLLEENKTYSVCVRAWYNRNTFAIFKSRGVTISQTDPSSSQIRRGGGVK